MSLDKGLELIRCAEINIENMAKMYPMISTHPFMQLVKEQIKEGIKELEKLEEG